EPPEPLQPPGTTRPPDAAPPSTAVSTPGPCRTIRGTSTTAAPPHHTARPPTTERRQPSPPAWHARRPSLSGTRRRPPSHSTPGVPRLPSPQRSGRSPRHLRAGPTARSKPPASRTIPRP
ncbi:hypothetical protein FOMPIDRAFT_30897, partial [Fomitopsis schrenkii]